MLLGSVGAGCGVVRTLLGRCPNAALMTSGHRLDTASMPPKLAPSDPGNIPNSCVLHWFYKHFAAGADGVRAAPRGASRRRPCCVRAASVRLSGNVRATSARCPGGIRAVAGRRPIRRQAIPELFTNVWFYAGFVTILPLQDMSCKVHAQAMQTRGGQCNSRHFLCWKSQVMSESGQPSRVQPRRCVPISPCQTFRLHLLL